MAEKKNKLVTVDKVAETFRISEREVQRLVIYHGMPRISRGEYDLEKCALWYADYLHGKVCGCAGPCEGFDAKSRNAVNATAERKRALKEITELAPDLVGLKADAIREILTKAVENSYDVT